MPPPTPSSQPNGAGGRLWRELGPWVLSALGGLLLIVLGYGSSKFGDWADAIEALRNDLHELGVEMRHDINETSLQLEQLRGELKISMQVAHSFAAAQERHERRPWHDQAGADLSTLRSEVRAVEGEMRSLRAE